MFAKYASTKFWNLWYQFGKLFENKHTMTYLLNLRLVLNLGDRVGVALLDGLVDRGLVSWVPCYQHQQQWKNVGNLHLWEWRNLHATVAYGHNRYTVNFFICWKKFRDIFFPTFLRILFPTNFLFVFMQ